LAHVCKVWEESLFRNNPKQIPLSVVRTGLVLSNKSKIVNAAQTQFLVCGMVGSVGSHSNRWSWVHIVDLCNQYIALIEGTLQPGIYNGVAPNPCTQGEFGDAYERFPAVNLPLWLPIWRLEFFLAKKLNGLIRFLGIRKRQIVPEWIIKLLWGERSVIALTNQYVSAQKTLDQGFCYQYPTIESAMQHLQGHPKI
jgi:NAD dependent epimerase/dehydratase family enzyme